MYDYYVGQKVVCVNNDEIEHSYENDHPPISSEIILNEVYTIRWVGWYTDDESFEVPFLGIRLMEVDRSNEYWFGDKEMPFCSSRFRPLIKTDISIFEQILNRKPVEILEDA